MWSPVGREQRWLSGGRKGRAAWLREASLGCQAHNLMPAHHMPAHDVESKEFLEDFRSGQIHPNQATKSIYDTYVNKVYKFLKRFLADDRDIDEVINDVFFTVHRRLHEFRGESSLKTWIFAICWYNVNSCWKARRWREVSDDEIVALQEDASADAEQTLLSKDANRILEQILDNMPLPQRAVFELFEIEELSRKEISEILQIPEGTVDSRLYHARLSFNRAVARLKASLTHQKRHPLSLP